jgi:hypothetical protein
MASAPLSRFTTFPPASRRIRRGRRSALRPVVLYSTTSLKLRPVTSSMRSIRVTFSIRSPNSTLPFFSVMIGSVKGSHSATFWPRVTVWPSSTSSFAP